MMTILRKLGSKKGKFSWGIANGNFFHFRSSSLSQ